MGGFSMPFDLCLKKKVLVEEKWLTPTNNRDLGGTLVAAQMWRGHSAIWLDQAPTITTSGAPC